MQRICNYIVTKYFFQIMFNNQITFVPLKWRENVLKGLSFLHRSPKMDLNTFKLMLTVCTLTKYS
uniref:Uncharacterized protein n=2 Tax=Anguilla anguilla TaxID=7936 RepID=A0A0E9RJE3_ANGAN